MRLEKTYDGRILVHKDEPTDADHEPDPVSSGTFVSLCRICTEKVVRDPDGSWSHFGVGQPYEKMTL